MTCQSKTAQNGRDSYELVQSVIALMKAIVVLPISKQILPSSITLACVNISRSSSSKRRFSGGFSGFFAVATLDEVVVGLARDFSAGVWLESAIGGS